MGEHFGKEYKLCSKKIIKQIFEEGKTLKNSPLILKYLDLDLDSKTSFQIAISVPKRKFKKAVDRNKLKRLMREAVRKNKFILEEASVSDNSKKALFLIYADSEKGNYQKIAHKIETLFKRLVESKS